MSSTDFSSLSGSFTGCSRTACGTFSGVYLLLSVSARCPGPLLRAPYRGAPYRAPYRAAAAGYPWRPT
ncbi:Hypothetical protein SMAX5B_012712, partial [Scophthalmus maximus]